MFLSLVQDQHQLTLWTELLDVSSDFTHNPGALKYKTSAMESHKTWLHYYPVLILTMANMILNYIYA